MKEAKTAKDFITRYLALKFPFMWHKKIHGDAYQKDIADNIFCINGKFLAIEFKVQRDGRISITPGQIKEINKIKNAKGIGLIIAFDENSGKAYVREKRLDYKTIFLSSSNKNVKSKNIKIDWDFELSTYEDIVDLINIMVEGV